MKTRTWRALGALATVLVCTATGATTLAIAGPTSYSINGSDLAYSSAVQNVDTMTSAMIRMEFWAFATPYSGGSLAGYKLADEGSYASPLGSGQARTDSIGGSYVPPPSGLWNVTVVWTEQDGNAANGGFSPRVYRNLGTLQFGSTAAPNIPTDVSTRALSPTEIVVRWTATTSNNVPADSYRIYLDGNFIGSVTSASASIFNLAASTTYYFSVAACDAAQNCSAASAGAWGTTLAAGSSSVANFTGLWWNSAESGWGINVTHEGDTVFATLFTYDATGRPLWLVMSNGVMQGNATIFSGQLHQTTGSPFNAIPFMPMDASNLTQVGSMTLAFSTGANGTLTYSVNGITVVKQITRQIYGSRVASCVETMGSRMGLTNYQDLWWNPSESGWGVNFTHQDDTIFATLFTYDASGRGLWLVMSNGTRQSDGSYVGTLYQTTGPPFNAQPFTPIGQANVIPVGTMRARFSDGMHGTLTYNYFGSTVVKAITRQEFAAGPPGCTS